MTTKSKYHEITTPEGRLVSGDPFHPRTRDGNGNVLTYKNEAKAGQPRIEFSVGIAIPKSSAATFHQQLVNLATESLPTLFAGGAEPPRFSWKRVDGDSQQPNDNGTIPAQKDGYPGHYVYFFTSDTAPKCYKYGEYSTELLGTGIKRGDYVMIAGTMKAHNDNNKPGVYLNLEKIAITREGEAIAGAGRTAAQAFGSVTGGAPMQQPTIAAPPTQAPAATPAAAPVVTQPHTGILNPQTVPASPGLPAAAPPPQVPAPAAGPVKRMYQGTAWEESALLQAGWTQDAINTLPVAQ